MHLTNALEKADSKVCRRSKKITSYSRPGVCVITSSLGDEVAGNTVRQRWRSCNIASTTAKKELPSGTVGLYNDRLMIRRICAIPVTASP